MGAMGSAYRLLVGKPEGKQRLGMRRYRWEGNIRMDFREMWLKVVDWIYLAKNRDLLWTCVNMVMKLYIP
jgi:hypothetical protein